MKKDSTEEGWWRFLKLCTQLKTPEQFNELLDLFLTIEEREALALRYLLIKKLLEGKRTQREISADLQISISKITRGSNALKIISNDLKEVILKSS
jgi:TrpR family trp operon transcriptional repressor